MIKTEHVPFRCCCCNHTAILGYLQLGKTKVWFSSVLFTMCCELVTVSRQLWVAEMMKLAELD